MLHFLRTSCPGRFLIRATRWSAFCYAQERPSCISTLMTAQGSCDPPQDSSGNVQHQAATHVLCRTMATSRTTQNTTVEDENFRIIYKFPYIVPARAVCRLKLVQTGVTLAVVPVTAVLTALGIVEVQWFLATVMTATLASVMLYVIGGFFRSLVGMMYLNSKGDTLKIAHLTFWGGRRDVLMPVDDIVPVADGNESPRNVYFTLSRYSDPKEKYYYVVRFGGILDRKLFLSVFGSS